MAHTTAIAAPTTSVRVAGVLYPVCAPCGNTGSTVVLYWDEQGVYDAMAPCPECCPDGRRGL